MVVGADGLHSRVRQLLFGPEEKFERFLGYAFAAFTVPAYEPRTPDIYIGYGVPGRQAFRFTMRGNRSLILFFWREADRTKIPDSGNGQRALLRQRFAGVGWECPRMLDRMDEAEDLYIDRVSQIHLPQWSHGRVALVGEAAWAPSFLAGEGTGLAIIGAYALAAELARSGGDCTAFTTYEQRLRGFIEGKQKMATRFGGAFVPKTRLGVAFRNLAANLLNVQPVANLALAAALKDEVELPDLKSAPNSDGHVYKDPQAYGSEPGKGECRD